MTVRELIDKLLDCDPDREVTVEAKGFNSYQEITDVLGARNADTELVIDVEAADLDLDVLDLVERE